MNSKKTSLLDDLLEVASLLPWQVGVILAPVSYLWLHHVATSPNSATAAPGQMGAFVGNQLFITFATFFQYILPLIFLMGAAISARNRKHRFKLIETQTGIESVRAMPWQDFEIFVGEAFRRQGYAVEELGGSTPDGGVDLVLYKGGQKSIVQCKRWKTYSVGVSPVRELYGVMTAESAHACIFVTSGTYTRDAIAFAKGKPIQLIDGSELVKLVGNVQSSMQIAGRNMDAESRVESTGPSCPVCGGEMIRRVAKKGANAGNQFWGCAKFPACRGVK